MGVGSIEANGATESYYKREILKLRINLHRFSLHFSRRRQLQLPTLIKVQIRMINTVPRPNSIPFLHS